MLKPCIDCGDLSERNRCPEHRPDDFTPSATKRGYDSAWQRLSLKARQLQPFCTLCGATDDLTVDHSPEAWQRKARGLSIRLADVRVLCRSCNSRAGRARPQGWGVGVGPLGSGPPGKANFRSHTPGGIQ